MKDFELIERRENKFFNSRNNIVLLTFDEGYYMQAINLMMSVKHYNDDVSFICICSQVPESIMAELLNERYNLGVCIYQYKANFTLKSKRWKDITCFRVFAPWLVDNDNVKEVLYLDCDMLCKGTLQPVFDIKDYLVVMCNEISGNVSKQQAFKDCTNIYCNAGLSKINLEAFRKTYKYNEISELFFENLDKLKCLDQDFLNYFLEEKGLKKINGCIYNFQPYEYLGSYCYKQIKENSVIIHFSVFRPWDRDCEIKEYFDLYLENSLYQPLIQIVKNEQKRAKQIAILRRFVFKRKKIK